MKIALTCSAITRKNGGNMFFFAELVGECDSIGKSELRTEMRNHTHNFMFLRTKMERAFAAFRISVELALPLSKKLMKRHTTSCKDSQISMHGKNIFLFIHGNYSSHRNCFLSNTRKPFGDLTLPKEVEHFFLNHSRIKEFSIYM